MLTNTIVANSGNAGDCSGPATSGGYNLSTDANLSCQAGGTDLVSTPAELTPLANNGGPTETLASSNLFHLGQPDRRMELHGSAPLLAVTATA